MFVPPPPFTRLPPLPRGGSAGDLDTPFYPAWFEPAFYVGAVALLYFFTNSPGGAHPAKPERMPKWERLGFADAGGYQHHLREKAEARRGNL